jgi:hypothetical protein
MIMLLCFVMFWQSTVLPSVANAEPQDLQAQRNQSVVEAARRSRELKKNAAQPARVITNEDVENETAKRARNDLNFPGLAAPQTESHNTNVATGTDAPSQTATSVNKDARLKSVELAEAAADDAEIARLKNKLVSTQNSLDWQRRQLLLDQNTIYSNPGYATTHAGKAEIDAAELQIDEKQQEIDSLKGSLADLVWRQWRRMQEHAAESGSQADANSSVPPSALVLPQPSYGQR